MAKTLTEQWRDGTLPQGWYYMIDCNGKEWFRYLFGEKPDADFVKFFKEVLAPVPRYDKVKEMSQKIERLEFDNEALEMAHNEEKEKNAELVSNSDELVQKVHILNEQNIKLYNELCAEIKKNNILEKRLKIATKALKYYAQCKPTEWMTCVTADKALEEMEGVK